MNNPKKITARKPLITVCGAQLSPSLGVILGRKPQITADNRAPKKRLSHRYKSLKNNNIYKRERDNRLFYSTPISIHFFTSFYVREGARNYLSQISGLYPMPQALFQKGIPCYRNHALIAASSPRSLLQSVPTTLIRLIAIKPFKATVAETRLSSVTIAARAKIWNTTMANGRWSCQTIGAARSNRAREFHATTPHKRATFAQGERCLAQLSRTTISQTLKIWAKVQRFLRGKNKFADRAGNSRQQNHIRSVVKKRITSKEK
ncbi:MAG: hypothetical protein HZA50_10070 [Planctomycetes bacterium]|nr:hypothetical protein [Planctomycetota bacterium]